MSEEYLALEPRITLCFERSCNEEMRKRSLRGKLFATIGKKINNRLAAFQWRAELRTMKKQWSARVIF